MWTINQRTIGDFIVCFLCLKCVKCGYLCEETTTYYFKNATLYFAPSHSCQLNFSDLCMVTWSPSFSAREGDKLCFCWRHNLGWWPDLTHWTFKSRCLKRLYLILCSFSCPAIQFHLRFVGLYYLRVSVLSVLSAAEGWHQLVRSDCERELDIPLKPFHPNEGEMCFHSSAAEV